MKLVTKAAMSLVVIAQITSVAFAAEDLQTKVDRHLEEARRSSVYTAIHTGFEANELNRRMPEVLRAENIFTTSKVTFDAASVADGINSGLNLSIEGTPLKDLTLGVVAKDQALKTVASAATSKAEKDEANQGRLLNTQTLKNISRLARNGNNPITSRAFSKFVLASAKSSMNHDQMKSYYEVNLKIDAIMARNQSITPDAALHQALTEIYGADADAKLEALTNCTI